MTDSKFTMGIYRHFRGDLYEATHLVLDASNGAARDEFLVFYAIVITPELAAKAEEKLDGPVLRYFVRGLKEFREDWVHADGKFCPDENCETERMRRFTYLGPQLQREMLKDRT